MESSKLSPENLWWTNVLLLGFDPISAEKLHGTSFSAEMFQRPNTKGMEIIMHFLFSTLVPDAQNKVHVH